MFVDIARVHHLQDFDRTNYLLTLVKIADHICHQMGIGLKYDAAIDLFETEEAHLINLAKADLKEMGNFLKPRPPGLDESKLFCTIKDSCPPRPPLFTMPPGAAPIPFNIISLTFTE